MSQQLRIACLQLQPRTSEDPDEFLDEVAERVRGARGCDLVVLPELWHVGYFSFDDYAENAQAPDGRVEQRLSQLARELGAVVHAGSVVERSEARGQLHNTSLVFAPDGERVARYRKMHVFGYQSREREFVSGGSELVTFPLGERQAGLAICYDLRFPELFRCTADDVALYVVPATWPAARVAHWKVLLQARAIENQAFVIGCNAAGTSGGVELGGNSAVFDPGGRVVAEAGFEPTMLETVIDLADVDRTRQDFPALRDRMLDVPAPVRAPNGSRRAL